MSEACVSRVLAFAFGERGKSNAISHRLEHGLACLHMLCAALQMLVIAACASGWRTAIRGPTPFARAPARRVSCLVLILQNTPNKHHSSLGGQGVSVNCNLGERLRRIDSHEVARCFGCRSDGMSRVLLRQVADSRRPDCSLPRQWLVHDRDICLLNSWH